MQCQSLSTILRPFAFRTLLGLYKQQQCCMSSFESVLGSLGRMSKGQTKTLDHGKSPLAGEADTSSASSSFNTDIHSSSESISLSSMLGRQQMIATKFARLLTKRGHCRDAILSRVLARLTIRYGKPHVLALAVDAIRPVVRYKKEPVKRKSYFPVALSEASSIGLAIRWILANVNSKEYFENGGGIRRTDLERSLEAELEAIVNGTSNLYAKRYQFHRNPNQ